MAPKPIRKAPAAFDVWSKVDVKGLEGDAAETKRGTIGADYRLAKGALVGMSAEIVGEGQTLQQDTRHWAIETHQALSASGLASR